MKRWLAVSVLTSMVLAGCCTRKPMDQFSSIDGTTPGTPWGICGIFSGWGTTEEPDRWRAVYSPVSPSEYGELLCGHLDPGYYATCVNEIWSHYRESTRPARQKGSASSGPFAVILGPNVMLGSYRSDAFSGSFRVSDGSLSCRGTYNAFLGAKDAIFDVYCDNGKSGWADFVRDRSGRNGIGRVYLDDGSVGKIVFGYATVGGALKTMGP